MEKKIYPRQRLVLLFLVMLAIQLLVNFIFDIGPQGDVGKLLYTLGVSLFITVVYIGVSELKQRRA